MVDVGNAINSNPLLNSHFQASLVGSDLQIQSLTGKSFELKQRVELVAPQAQPELAQVVSVLGTTQIPFDPIQTSSSTISSTYYGSLTIDATSGLTMTTSATDLSFLGLIGQKSYPPPSPSGSLSTLSLLTTEQSQLAIEQIDSALNTVNSVRSEYGAIQNRFASTISNLSNTAQNLSLARSRILDADFAQENAQLTKAQIIQQAATAMLTQANSLPQNVLSLLRA